MNLFFTTGCASTKTGVPGQTVDSRAFLELRRGASLSEIEEVFRVKSTHEFTTRRNRDQVQCVSYDLIGPATSQTYYFVFTNNALASICLPPPFQYETNVENGYRVNRAVTRQPEGRVEAVIQSEDLNGEALGQTISRVMSNKRSKKDVSMNILPAFIILSPLFIAAAPFHSVQAQQERVELKAQRTRFDPFQIHLGMTVEQVEVFYGTPFIVDQSVDGLETRFYGPASRVAYTEPWTSVVFDQRKAVRVFSDHFLDLEKIQRKTGKG